MQARIIGTGLLFLFIFTSGVWLSNAGKPLNVAILTAHKLVSLAAVALIAMTVYQLQSEARMSAAEIGASVVVAALFLLMGVTGGLLSAGKPVPAAVLAAHRVAPLLTVLSTAVTIYLLAGRR